MRDWNAQGKSARVGNPQSVGGVLGTNCLTRSILTVVAFALLGITSSAEPPRVVERFAQAGNAKEEKALAKRLGDEYLAREATRALTKSGKEDVQAFLMDLHLKEDVEGFIDRQLALTASNVGEERAEANLQIQRLWWVAAPRLIDYIGHENDTINEAAMKNLILMRSEEIVKRIIERVRTTDNERVRKWGVFTLGMMCEKRETLIPGRPLLSDEESERLAKTYIEPFLTEVDKAHDDPDLKQTIEGARQFLANPADRRLRPVTRPPDTPR